MTQQNILAHVERPLTPEDHDVLAQPKNSKPAPIARISSKHHRLARMLAEGASPGEAGLACGYVASRVSVLQADPTFRDLVQNYRSQVDATYLDLHERLSGIAMDATEEIQHRLETSPEELDMGDLMKIVQLGADRTGHGPTSTQNTNHTVNFAQRLDAARARVKPTEVIEGDFKNVSSN